MENSRKPSAGFYRLCLLLIGIYAASYITRINFGAVISEIITAEGYSRSATSLAVTVICLGAANAWKKFTER